MNGPVMNPFRNLEDAYFYHEFRPHFHDVPVRLLNDFFEKQPQSALDVACGTGHSSIALKSVVSEVYGLDNVSKMVEVAKESYPEIQFFEGKAENLPFTNGSVDLVNISMGLHWVDHHLFLKEASRVLINKGYLVVDNYGFEGIISNARIEQEEHFKFFTEFLPSANKNKSYSEKGLLHVNSLSLVKTEKYQKVIEMDGESFINFLQTTSNFLILNDSEREDALEEMRSVYGKIFNGQSLKLGFGGELRIYQKEV